MPAKSLLSQPPNNVVYKKCTDSPKPCCVVVKNATGDYTTTPKNACGQKCQCYILWTLRSYKSPAGDKYPDFNEGYFPGCEAFTAIKGNGAVDKPGDEYDQFVAHGWVPEPMCLEKKEGFPIIDKVASKKLITTLLPMPPVNQVFKKCGSAKCADIELVQDPVTKKKIIKIAKAKTPCKEKCRCILLFILRDPDDVPNPPKANRYPRFNESYLEYSEHWIDINNKGDVDLPAEDYETFLEYGWTIRAKCVEWDATSKHPVKDQAKSDALR